MEVDRLLKLTELIKINKENRKATKLRKVPTILQMEAVECGAASLDMILAYFGIYIPLEVLRIDCGVSRDGSKASNIIKAARKYGLEAKGYRKEPKSLKTMELPMIIHWNFNHFLVLEGFRKGKVYLSDPASGKRVVSEQEFDESFTGIALTFKKGDAFKTGGEKPNIMLALGRRLKGSASSLSYIILTGLALVIPGLIIPVFSKIFIDDILISGRTDWIAMLLLLMGTTLVVQGGLTWIQGYYLLKLETKIALSSASKFLWHVLRLPAEFFSQRYAGDISSRMQSNDKVAEIMSSEFVKSCLSVFMIVFYFILMIQYDIFLTLIGVTAAILNLLYLKLVSSKRTNENNLLLKDQGKLIGTSMSGLQTIETLKATGSESDFFSKWAGYHAKTANAQQHMGVSSSYLSILPVLLKSVTDVVVLIVGGMRIMNGELSIGALVAFQSLMISFLNPISSLMNIGSVIQTMVGDMNRLDDVMKYPEDSELATEAVEIQEDSKEKLEGYVEIRNLSFGYSRLELPLIEDFNFKLEPGARVALVGGSGSGKSTVAKLICGIYQPWCGEILFDGQDKRKIPRILTTSSLSVVDQDICMFNASVKDNITLWDDSIPETDVIKAAKDACIHDDIIERSGGYSHVMGEGGMNFSGGQRQRIEIARALVYNPSMLILDEATSALDPNTERMVYENICRRGCTCIIVAHRMSTIRDSNEIIILDQGKIVQRGTHDELKQIDGYYARLISAI
ncbi:MAG: NHLP family bacteriocin export ABC transporter peptidase/permease/ATPase subunit [Peptostreptococcaceae bacterium]|nr:NHLP family bacteriocin export ABC transporter peptidase/permease/ATPase subunit [Peptostreptococcaceae bacterium]